jgi:uncharacterized SAM-binding protein YcdF (DUF218 family)
MTSQRTLPSSRRLRRFVVAASVLAVLLVAAYLARGAILTALGEFLTVEDDPAQADVIFVLAGEANVRPARASELYHAGLAPRILIPEPEPFPSHASIALPNVTAVATEVMRHLGVPDTAIVVLEMPGGSTSTIDDARLLRAYVERHGVRRVLVVTSMFHARRTRWVLRRVLKGLDVAVLMAPAADTRFNERNWWRHEAGLLAYVEEYLKWLHNRGQL